jgi:hypothetical protein
MIHRGTITVRDAERTRPGRTVITFDQPDERRIDVPWLLPMLRRDDEISLEYEDEVYTHVIRSAVLNLELKSGELTLYLRLRL